MPLTLYRVAFKTREIFGLSSTKLYFLWLAAAVAVDVWMGGDSAEVLHHALQVPHLVVQLLRAVGRLQRNNMKKLLSYVFGPPGSGSVFICTNPDPSINKQKK